MIENILIRKQTPTDGKYLYRFDEQSNRYYISTCALFIRQIQSGMNVQKNENCF